MRVMDAARAMRMTLERSIEGSGGGSADAIERARACVENLDAIERELEKDAASDRRAGMDEASKDAELARVQSEAEERERDPRVKALIEDAKTLAMAPEGTTRGRELTMAFAEKMERALALEPDFYQASLQLAMVYQAHGYVASAIERVTAAYEHTPGCFLAYALAGQMYEDVGLYNRAEEEYAKCVGVSFDFADAWVSLARLSANKFGAISSAIHLMRVAKLGGPEAKFTKPGKHPLLLFSLAHALHITGYSAEPTSLYTQALHAGAGVMAIYPLCKLANDCADDEGASMWAKTWRDARDACREDDSSADSFFASLEVFNAASAGPQWHEILNSKVRAYEIIADRDVDGLVRAPTLFTSDSLETLIESDEILDEVVVLKGAHAKFPGVVEEKINRVGVLKDFKAIITDGKARRTRGEIIAQRRVREVATDEFGRKCTVRVRACFVPDQAAADDVVLIAKSVCILSAASAYDKTADIASSEYDDKMYAREMTNRGLSGDSSATMREVDVKDACTRVMGIDDVSSDIIAQAEIVMRAFRDAVRDERNVIQDARYDAYAAVGAPLFLNLDFIVESGETPRAHFLGVGERPSFRLERERAFVRDVWSRVVDALDDDFADADARDDEFIKIVVKS